ncbi:MAG TPA: hypothetical protein VK927_07735, partial [Adhaeribacter sp.]|nr:hypothetical protein [Adhaeribacter sp.]
LPYLGGLSEANSYFSELHLVIGIGNCAAKFRIANSLSSPNLRFPNLIHPSVSLSGQQYFQIGQGTIIGEGTVITTNVRLGSFVQVSPRCTLAHDVQIADFCSLMFSVNLAGNVKLKPRVYLGTNSTVIQLLEIGEDTIVGAGAVVIRSLPARCTAAGVPAKIIKTHEIPA